LTIICYLPQLINHISKIGGKEMSIVNIVHLASELVSIASSDVAGTLANILKFEQIEPCDQTDINQFENEFLRRNENLAESYWEIQEQTDEMSPQDLLQSYQTNFEQAQFNIEIAQDAARILDATFGNGKHLDVPDYAQGHNECGPNALRMVYAYYGMHGSFNIHDNYFLGTSVRDLEEYAHDHGMKAGIVNNSNVDAIKQYIDQDMPVILLGKNLAGGEDHYLVVTGYSEQADGSLRFNINDGDRTTNESLSQQELETFWEENYIPGSHNLMLVIAPEHSKQADYVPETNLGDDTTTINIMESLDDVLYSTADTFWPFDTNGDFVGWGDWASNAWEGHANAIGGATNLPAQGLALGLDQAGGWIGGIVGDLMQDVANDISEFAYVSQNQVGDILQNPLSAFTSFNANPLSAFTSFNANPLSAFTSSNANPLSIATGFVPDPISTTTSFLSDPVGTFCDFIGF
jgi:hypothetical protein